MAWTSPPKSCKGNSRYTREIDWTPENAGKLTEAVRQIDEHLAVSTLRVPPAGVAVIISPRADTPTMTSAMAMDQPRSSPPPVPGVINVGGRVQAHKLISNPQPVYPTIARQARISGTVELAGGNRLLMDMFSKLTVLSGHPLLRQAALDAVKQWVYEPTLLNESAGLSCDHNRRDLTLYQIIERPS